MATWPVQWRTVRKGGDPITDQEGTTRTPGWHPEENATQLPAKVLSNQRGLHQRTPKGRDPKTLERAVKLSEGIVAYSLCKPTSYFFCCVFSFTCDLVSLTTAARIPLLLPTTSSSSSLDGLQPLLKTVWSHRCRSRGGCRSRCETTVPGSRQCR